MSHPLDPLSAEEITLAVELFRSAHEKDGAFFSSIGLVEPEKAAVKSGSTPIRMARVLGVDQTPDGGFAADVDLTNRRCAIERLPGSAQAPYGYADLGMAVLLTKQNEDLLARARRPQTLET